MGVKKTPEFGHVLVFGKGGSNVEEKKDISFRVCPLKKNDFKEIILDTSIGRKTNFFEKRIIQKNLKKLNRLVLKYPKILELDINPLMGKSIVDARIVFK